MSAADTEAPPTDVEMNDAVSDVSTTLSFKVWRTGFRILSKFRFGPVQYVLLCAG